MGRAEGWTWWMGGRDGGKYWGGVLDIPGLVIVNVSSWCFIRVLAGLLFATSRSLLVA